MLEAFEIGRMIGQDKAGPAGLVRCGWGYRGVAWSTSRVGGKDGGMQVPGKVPMLRDGQRRGLLECRMLANSEQWKASWEPVDSTECWVWFQKLKADRRMAGSCSRSNYPSETFDPDPEGKVSGGVEIEHQVEDWDKLYNLFQKCHENASQRSQGMPERDDSIRSVGEVSASRKSTSGPGSDYTARSGAKLPGSLDVNIRDGGILKMGTGVNRGGPRSDVSNIRRASVQASSIESYSDLNNDEEELFEDRRGDDNGFDPAWEAGRSFSRVDPVAKSKRKQTSVLGNHPAGSLRDRESSPPNSRRRPHVEENEFDRTAFLRSREVEVRQDKGGEREWEHDEDTSRYPGNSGSERETSTTSGQKSKEIDDWQNPSDYDQASSRRIQSSQSRFGSKDEVIRRRLRAMEQEVTERDGSFRSKDTASVTGWKAMKKVDTALAKFPDGPIMTRSSLLAKQVISQDSAMSLGFVVQIWVEVDQWKVVAIEIRPSMLFGLVDAILLENLGQIGDVVLVPDEDALEGELDWTGCQPVVGFDIFTENALYLGKVRDFEFNLNNGGVTSLEFDSFGVPLIPSSVVSTFSLPIREIVEVGEDCLLVRAGAEKRMQVLTKGLWGKISGDISPPKGVKPDDRLVLKSLSRRNPRAGDGKQRMSRADISRAQEVADMYVSSRKSGSYGSREEQQEPSKDNDRYIRKQKTKPASRDGDLRRDVIRTRDKMPEDEEFDP